MLGQMTSMGVDFDNNQTEKCPLALLLLLFVSAVFFSLFLVNRRVNEITDESPTEGMTSTRHRTE